MNQPLTPQTLSEDDFQNRALRPLTLGDFTGQNDLKRQLSITISAAKSRNDAIDHIIFFGPPGLGKTTLAQIVANEMGYSFRTVNAPTLSKQSDIASLLISLEKDSVLFIDEIHRLNKNIVEMLYTAMEDHRVDILIGEGMSLKTISLDIPRFVLIGATTRTGMLPAPLRDRFGLHLKLEYYTEDDLLSILKRTCSLLSLSYTDEALVSLAQKSRGTPRIAKRLLSRVRDYCQAHNEPIVTLDTVKETMKIIGIDENGLDKQDRDYLSMIYTHYKGGPVGIETLAVSLNEDRDILETSIEPYLISKGLLQRTSRGRSITDGAKLIIPHFTS